MKTNKPSKSQTAKRIRLIQELFCGDDPGPVLTQEQERFLTERAKLENRIFEILMLNNPEEMKLIDEYGLTGVVEEVKREWEELGILNV